MSTLAISAAAALAGTAYLSAKSQISYDYMLLSLMVRAAVHLTLQERRDRLNQFYVIEKKALTKSSADRTFLIYEGKSWSYNDFYETVLKYGTWLKQECGIAPKEIVAIDFMNSPQFLFLWYGLWAIGATPAHINYNLTGDPLIHALKTSTAKIAFVDPEIKYQFSSKVLSALSSLGQNSSKDSFQIVYFNPALEDHILNIPPGREPDSSRSAHQLDLAQLIFTSGTTGLPKAGYVSWRKVLLLEGFVPGLLSLKKSDRYYTCMPLYHSAACFNAVIPTLVTGSTLILGRRFSTTTFWNEVCHNRATMIQYVGETLRYVLAAPPNPLERENDVRLAFGNGLRPDVWERFKDRFGVETIVEFYGATEGVSALWNLSGNSFSSGAIGRNGYLLQLLSSLFITVVQVDWTTGTLLRDPESGFCRKSPRGEVGELLFVVDPKDVFKKYQGYFGDEVASSSKIISNVHKEGDAYFRSGDVVRWDKEGRWWFVDRIGDTYRWKSENVSTAEVSEVLGRHSAILEANVYGVEVPHHDGRAGCAAVVLRDGDAGETVLEDLSKHAVKALPKFAVPLFLRIVTQSMTTGNNKQQKAELRAEGVNPEKARTRGDRLVWLRNGRYVDFKNKEWNELNGGRVRL